MTVNAICPGCSLEMPSRPALTAHGYYNAAPECWSVYTEVLGAEYSNAVLFGQVHQLTVDSYATQHAGGGHPDKSLGVHLSGLHLMIDRGVRGTEVPPLLQSLASSVAVWPRFDQPRAQWPLTVADVALASTASEHAEVVRAWSAAVWAGWQHMHETIAAIVAESRVPP